MPIPSVIYITNINYTSSRTGENIPQVGLDPSPYDDEPFNIVFLDVKATTGELVDKSLGYKNGSFYLSEKRGAYFLIDYFDPGNVKFKMKCVYNKKGEDELIVGKWVWIMPDGRLGIVEDRESGSQFILANKRLIAASDDNKIKRQIGYDPHGNLGCDYETPFDVNFSLVPPKEDDPDAVFVKFNIAAYEDPERTKLSKTGFLTHYETNGYVYFIDKAETALVYKIVKVFNNKFAIQVRDRRSKFNGKFVWATTAQGASWYSSSGVGNMKLSPPEVTESDSVPFECTLWQFEPAGKFTNVRCLDSSRRPANTKDQLLTMDLKSSYLFAKNTPPDAPHVVPVAVQVEVLEFSRKLKGGSGFDFFQWINEDPERFSHSSSSSSSSSSSVPSSEQKAEVKEEEEHDEIFS